LHVFDIILHLLLPRLYIRNDLLIGGMRAMLQHKYVSNRRISGVQGRLGFYVGVASSHPYSVCWTKGVINPYVY